MHLLLFSILLLGGLGFFGALFLYFTARRFHVEEDPRVDRIASLLAGANCGGCGLKGCRDFAVRCVSQGSLDGLYCPVSGADGMAKIAEVLGIEASPDQSRQVAVLRCNGSCAARPLKYVYDGAQSCAVMASVAVGTSGCAFGCLGCGDCADVCAFGALSIDKATGLPVVDTSLCTACGACVSECPRKLIELRPVGRKDRRVWVACSSRDKGAIARKLCTAACIGCGKCAKACPFGAIEVADNLAYINPETCKTCGKCVPECPTGAILSSFDIPMKKVAEQ